MNEKFANLNNESVERLQDILAETNERLSALIGIIDQLKTVEEFTKARAEIEAAFAKIEYAKNLLEQKQTFTNPQ